MHSIVHEFTDKKISPWGGIKLFQQLWQRLGARDFVLNLPIPTPGSNHGYDPIDIIEGFMTSVILGARRLEHCGTLRHDSVIQEIFGWKHGMASGTTFGRFFKRFNHEVNQVVFPELMRYSLSKVDCRFMTIDVDSTVMTRYGQQEGVKKGYNPHKPGRAGHHPLLAFCDETKLVVNGQLRAGDTGSSTNIVSFTKETIKIVGAQNIGLMRFDRGFYADELMSFLEQPDVNVPYLIKVRLTKKVWLAIANQENWISNDDITDGAIYSEGRHLSDLWDKPRRIIYVGVPLKKAEDRNKIQKLLFDEEDIISKYEFFAFVTNTKMSMVETHRRYNQRGDAENRIKELKYDFAADGFVTSQFNSTDAAFRLVLFTYNMMQIFKQAILQPRVNHRLSTVKFQCIALGSYVAKSGGKKTLKLAAEGKRRHFLQHIFDKIDQIRADFVFSTA